MRGTPPAGLRGQRARYRGPAHSFGRRGNGVPVVKKRCTPPLYPMVELGQTIPTEHCKAVAQITRLCVFRPGLARAKQLAEKFTEKINKSFTDSAIV